MMNAEHESFRALGALLFACAVVGCSSARGRARGTAEGDFYTTVHLTKAEALRTVFPRAHRVVRDDLRLSAEEVRQASGRLGTPLRQREFAVYLGVGANDAVDGFAVIQEEIGKFKRITFIVGVEPSGAIRRVAVMVYREARGGEVAKRRFLVQYDGKTAADPFSINRDIINISGATMSVHSMNRGVKKVLAVVETVYGRRPMRLRRAVEAGVEEASFSHDATGRRTPGAGGVIEHREARLVMGSLCEIEVWGRDRRRLRRACQQAFLEIERVDSALSDYRADSELSRLSRQAGAAAMPISDLAAEFLRRADGISAASNGAFDLTVGVLIDAFRSRSSGLGGRPSRRELRAMAHLVDRRQIELRRTPDGGWLARLGTAGMRLDPGGLGKGFAVDRAAACLKEQGIERALVNFSGCMYALGAPPGRAGWTVAVRHPARPDSFLGLVSLADQAIASSGGYEKGFEVGGKLLSHIVSPLTLRPVDGVFGAVVVASDATSADGWSTAATVLGHRALADMERVCGLEGVVALRSGPRATNGWTSLGEFES